MTTTDKSTAAEEVKLVLNRVYEAWANNDAESFAALYNDASAVLPSNYLQGREAIATYMAGGFQGPLKGSTGVDWPQSFRIYNNDTAVVVSKAGILMAGEDELPEDRERIATWILVKQGGEWWITAYTNTPAH